MSTTPDPEPAFLPPPRVTPVGPPEPVPASVRVKANLTRVLPIFVLALLAFVVGINLGGLTRSSQGEFTLFGHLFVVPRGWMLVIIIVLTLVFVITGVMASRAVGRELGRVGTARAGLAVGAAIRLGCLIVGYLTVAFGVLGMLQVDVGGLLVGGAVTGVIIGIAAQQTLGNFFAGLVLLFTRPYEPGQRITVHTGAMGGPFEGVIVETGLIYTIIQTDHGRVSMPNGGLLASAIGPATSADPEEQI